VLISILQKFIMRIITEDNNGEGQGKTEGLVAKPCSLAFDEMLYSQLLKKTMINSVRRDVLQGGT
jgi:hypothetical protein